MDQVGIIFKILRIKNSLYWTNFVTLNKPIKQLLIQNSNTKDENTHRHLNKWANAISCIFLYCATVDNKLIPKDYLLIYLLINYGKVKHSIKYKDFGITEIFTIFESEQLQTMVESIV